jgi:hypothetical protein
MRAVAAPSPEAPPVTIAEREESSFKSASNGTNPLILMDLIYLIDENVNLRRKVTENACPVKHFRAP